MDRADIPFLPAGELSGLIEKKAISPVEATQAYLERIDDLDFKFNSYLTVCRKEALQAAQEAERAIARGNYLGPMHGIPVAVKDQMRTKGIRSTGGSRILADFIPDEDATVIANLKRSGAILLGKTNMTEFAMGGGIERSGAATAAFLCATSLGEDTGGSIRWPAAWCGLVGLKPTWGRVSRHGLMSGVWSMDAVGPISRTVEDAAITLEAIAGYDPKDPYTWSTPVPDYRQALDGNIKGMRVGVITELINSDVVEPEVREAVVKATAVLSELGASVDEVSVPLAKHAFIIRLISGIVEPALNQRDWIRKRLQDYGHNNRISLLTGSIVPAQVYYKAQKLRSLVRQQVQEAFDKYDVLVSPTVGKTPQRMQEDPVITNKEVVLSRSHLLTAMFNLANATAITVPCGLSSQCLPIGLQIAGRPGGEETVLKVSHAYEQHADWHNMSPPAAQRRPVRSLPGPSP